MRLKTCWCLECLKKCRNWVVFLEELVEFRVLKGHLLVKSVSDPIKSSTVNIITSQFGKMKYNRNRIEGQRKAISELFREKVA